MLHPIHYPSGLAWMIISLGKLAFGIVFPLHMATGRSFSLHVWCTGSELPSQITGSITHRCRLSGFYSNMEVNKCMTKVTSLTTKSCDVVYKVNNLEYALKKQTEKETST